MEGIANLRFFSFFRGVGVCVCVCVREREREREFWHAQPFCESSINLDGKKLTGKQTPI